MGNKLTITTLGVISFILVLSGCASYKTPGPSADLSVLQKSAYVSGPHDVHPDMNIAGTDDDIQEIINRKPAALIPAHLITIRLQGADYWSYSSGAGNIRVGNYTVITVHDIEEDQDFTRISKFPDLAQVGTINKMLLPRQISSDMDLRVSAAKLRADMLFIYTVDTKFWNEDMATPLSVVSLGLSPNVNVHMISTVSGILYDVRTGFIYGVVDATEKQKQLTSWWQSADAADQTRLRVERVAFVKMLDEFEKLWVGVVNDRRVAISGASAVTEVH